MPLYLLPTCLKCNRGCAISSRMSVWGKVLATQKQQRANDRPCMPAPVLCQAEFTCRAGFLSHRHNRKIKSLYLLPASLSCSNCCAMSSGTSVWGKVLAIQKQQRATARPCLSAPVLCQAEFMCRAECLSRRHNKKMISLYLLPASLSCSSRCAFCSKPVSSALLDTSSSCSGCCSSFCRPVCNSPCICIEAKSWSDTVLVVVEAPSSAGPPAAALASA